MITRFLMYLSCLAGSLVFYLYYQEWVSWVVLVAVAAIPWVSLLLSLPAILQFRAELDTPGFVTMGQKAHAFIWGLSDLPQPLFKGKLLLTNLNTGETYKHAHRTPLPTNHCGAWEVSARKVRICDYLGIFALPMGKIQPKTTVVRPKPLALNNPPELSRYLAHSWHPKFGGGFAENHELRPYRPGDNLNQVHWKLSAKTGSLILREPMEPDLGLVLLSLDLTGTADQIDRKFGRLLWLSQDLLNRGLRHEIHCLTGDGPVRHTVNQESDLIIAIDTLLRCPWADEGTIAGDETAASWQYHIGGDADET